MNCEVAKWQIRDSHSAACWWQLEEDDEEETIKLKVIDQKLKLADKREEMCSDTPDIHFECITGSHQLGVNHPI